MCQITAPDEILYRRIHINPEFWDKEFDRPSSAAFKDPKGLSVFRRGGREENEVLNHLKCIFSSQTTKTFVYISVNICIDIDVYVKDKSNNSDYHAEIHDSRNTIEICSSKRKKLAEAFRECHCNG